MSAQLVISRPTRSGRDAQRIGVVDSGVMVNHSGLTLAKVLGAGLFDIAHGVRGSALGNHAIGLQLAVLEQGHNAVVILQLLHIHRLDDACRIDLLQNPVFDVGNVVGVRLGYGALGGGVRIRSVISSVMPRSFLHCSAMA